VLESTGLMLLNSMLQENCCHDMVASKRKEQGQFLEGINSMSSVFLALYGSCAFSVGWRVL